jgi:hypothetical protein
MNERIQELLIEAHKQTNGGIYNGHLSVWTEKFAQLIVLECVKLCEHKSNDDEYDQYDMGQSVKAENIKTAIKQHFGVEEK